MDGRRDIEYSKGSLEYLMCAGYLRIVSHKKTNIERTSVMING